MNVVVLGSWRSGTSLTTSLISSLGLDVGRPSDHSPADDYNPRGYFELHELMEYSRTAVPRVFGPLLEKSGFTNTKWRDIPGLTSVLDEGRSIWGGLRTSDSMVIKLPDGGGAPLEFWREVFGVPSVFVVPFRHPFEVASSRAKFRAEGPVTRRELVRHLYLWSRFHQVLLPQLNGSDVFFVEYGDLLAQPARIADELFHALRGWGVPVDDANLSASADLVDPALYRNPVQPLPHWFPLPRSARLYAQLRELRGGHRNFSSVGVPTDGFDLYSRAIVKLYGDFE